MLREQRDTSELLRDQAEQQLAQRYGPHSAAPHSAGHAASAHSAGRLRLLREAVLCPPSRASKIL
jgi:hypothetical protein